MKKGFTLIELLVVISIISLLSSIVLAAINDARNKAKWAIAIDEVALLTEAIIIAQGNTGKTLQHITGNGCTRCGVCSGSLDGGVDDCYTNWVSAVDKIVSAAGPVYKDIGLSLYRDPWGSPYILDENEGEFPLEYCRRDYVFIAGPDRNMGGSDNIVINLPYTSTGDRICND